MNTVARGSFRSGSAFICVCVYCLAGLLGCAPGPTPTLFVPPTLPAAAIPSSQPPTPTGASAGTPLSTPSPPAPTAAPPCSNGLTFLQDLTLPDGTVVSSGQQMDKQWAVSNSGTCDWDARYRLRLVEGDGMGAPGEQALYPARAGTQAVIRILFTAPPQAGAYVSQWRATGPDGQSFGDPIFIVIAVSP